tara:strand:+ start:4061 stop:4594 length:534 start_codon:yes stop_codon:yes gene_type:complete
MNENFDMATPISSLNNDTTNVSNLVKQVETNLENFNQNKNEDNLSINRENFPLPKDPYQYNPNIQIENVPINTVQQNSYIPEFLKEIPENQIPISNNIPEETKEVKEEKKSFFKSLLSSCKEFFIIVLLYTIISHKKISKLLLFYVPLLSQFNSLLPLIFFKGIIFAILLFTIKFFI